MTWTTCSLGEAVELQRGYDLPEQERRPGKFPIVGSAGPNGFHDKANLQAPGVVIGRSGAGFGSAHYCEVDFWALNTGLFVKDFRGNHPRFIFYLLDHIDFSKYNSGGAQPSLNRNFIYPILVRLPEPDEQARIADTLVEWDAAIDCVEQLTNEKERFLNQARESILARQRSVSPIKLRNATRELAIRNGTALSRDSVMAVTKEVGMRPMREESIASDIARYKVVPPQAFAYNPMRLNIGSIAMSQFDSDVLVSPDYVVFECDESKLLPGYLNHLRHTRHWRSYFGQAGNGSVRVRIYYDDLGAFSFPLPPVDVQARIVRLLDAATREITLLRQEGEALRKQKRGLMQKLLTGEWRLPLREEEAV